MIDWAHFTPVSALVGGLIIGLAAVLLILINGRIAGISGILGGLLTPSRGESAWRAAFLLGMIAAPLLWLALAALPAIQIEASTPLLIVAGLLVGFGTRLGSGCTSGHGVCGLSRLSPRSLVATVLFMGAGFATVFVVRHVLGGV
ncbi:YeeE/YedE family protein [Marinobacter halodurans]|uniref:YeeE/YedE family protein n=2 Tax=Marinobacter halodurans TaxID=2528979 RepID=A0ABY1ZKP7_9GAMM|nr:YeeE/YedE family protein [Marinobacter halodurans]